MYGVMLCNYPILTKIQRLYGNVQFNKVLHGEL